MGTFIGFSRANGIRGTLSWLICKVTGRKYSHCWILVEKLLFNQDFVLEAGVRGFTPVPWGVFKAENTIVHLVTAPKPIYLGLSEAAGLISEKYDIPGLLGAGIVYILRRFGKYIKNPFQNSKELFCSEAVGMVLARSGYKIPDGMSESELNAGDIYDMVCKAEL